MGFLVLLIPNVVNRPVFDLADPETGGVRGMTPEEQAIWEDYIARLDNYNVFADFLNQWPVNGVYKNVVDCDKAPVWEKEDEYFNLFVLRTMRVDSVNIVAFANQQRVDMIKADLDFEIVIDNEGRGWLTDNDYTPVSGGEV